MVDLSPTTTYLADTKMTINGALIHFLAILVIVI